MPSVVGDNRPATAKSLSPAQRFSAFHPPRPPQTVPHRAQPFCTAAAVLTLRCAVCQAAPTSVHQKVCPRLSASAPSKAPVRQKPPPRAPAFLHSRSGFNPTECRRPLATTVCDRSKKFVSGSALQRLPKPPSAKNRPPRAPAFCTAAAVLTLRSAVCQAAPARPPPKSLSPAQRFSAFQSPRPPKTVTHARQPFCPAAAVLTLRCAVGQAASARPPPKSLSPAQRFSAFQSPRPPKTVTPCAQAFLHRRSGFNSAECRLSSRSHLRPPKGLSPAQRFSAHQPTRPPKTVPHARKPFCTAAAVLTLRCAVCQAAPTSVRPKSLSPAQRFSAHQPPRPPKTIPHARSLFAPPQRF